MARDAIARKRAVRLGFRALQLSMQTLPTVAPETLRDVLQAEAVAPLKGPARDMRHDGLFGDSHLQIDLFKHT